MTFLNPLVSVMELKLKDSTLDIRTDLNLSSINFPKFDKNATAPDDLNEYLRDQLEQMKRENEALLETLSARNEQIEQDQSRIEELRERLINYEGCSKSEFTSATQMANIKIVELNKKLREKNSEIEVYKTKCTKIEKSLADLKQKETENLEIDKPKITVNEPGEMKKIQDKLTYISNKWAEEKSLNLKLKNDLKLANKWLVQEVGDKFETLLTLNNSNSSWRGRAQVICDLQQKNYELKEKLKSYQENKDKDVSTVRSEGTLGKNDRKLEVLSNENFELKNSYSELKRKFDALKARCKVLETEYGLLKTKVSKMTEIHEADQQTVTKLTSQMSHYNEMKNEDLKQKEQLIKNLQQENEDLKVQLVKERCLSENKSKELLEKNDDILLLNKRIRSARPTSSYVNRPGNPETKTINKLEVERLRLLELTNLQNSKLQDERNSHSKTLNLLRAEKQRCAKLEANVAKLELECSNSRSVYSNKPNFSKQIEFDIKDKLELAEENIKALTTRLEIETMERKREVQQFCKILQNCTCT